MSQMGTSSFGIIPVKRRTVRYGEGDNKERGSLVGKFAKGILSDLYFLSTVFKIFYQLTLREHQVALVINFISTKD